MPFQAVAPDVVERIRELRYMDGLSRAATGRLVGVGSTAVGRYAPGRPGKVPNGKARALFERSALSAVDVARSMGWLHRNGQGKIGADGLRVMRTLGLADDVSRGYRCRRQWIDAETAGDLAEAMGHARWEALPDDRWA